MSEEKVIKELELALKNNNVVYNRDYHKEIMIAIQVLLDLYRAEKENNKEIIDKIEEKIKLIDNDIHISNMKRCNATMTTAMKEKYKVNYSAETIKNMLQELLEKRN